MIEWIFVILEQIWYNKKSKEKIFRYRSLKMENLDFNPSQLQAMAHFQNPMLVLAGPGSGKTTVVVHRVKNLIEKYNVNPSKILVITFTKAAAVEMETRFRAMEGCQYKRVTFGTFHSLFFRILRDSMGYQLNQVFNEEEKWNVLKNIVREQELEINDEEEYTRDFTAELSKMKNDLIELKYFNPFQFPKEEFQRIYHQYDQYKARQGKIDFDDMLTECYTLLKNEPGVLEKWRDRYHYILVDEFQDINKAQYECVKLLAAPRNNLFIVGDDDQSIYRFRGARPEFLLGFTKDFPDAKRVLLNINYRSTDSLIKLSNRLVSNNQKRFQKEFQGTNKSGALSEFFSAEDAAEESRRIVQKIQKLHEKGMPYESIAILFRTNMQAGNYTRALTNCGISYNLKDNVANLYEHWVAKDLSSYFLLALNEGDNQAFIRIINKPKRYVSKEILKRLENQQGMMLKNIFTLSELKPWQSKQIVALQQDLAQIRKRKPYEALKYIRNVIGYDEYLEEYAQYRKNNVMGIKEIADEITQLGKEAESLEAFLTQLEQLSQEIKENKKTSNKLLEHAVTLSTLHSAKGLEFDAVFIPSVVEGILPHEKCQREEEIEEERRLFYVGVTRARFHLCLSEICTRYDKETERSRFLKELGLKEREKKQKEILKRRR